MKTVKISASTHDIQEHPLLVRIAHWAQALAIIIMVGSGWRIYNSDPIFDNFRFWQWATLGGDPPVAKIAHMDPGVANALNWHFSGLWLLLASYLLFIIHGLVSGHFRRDFLPLNLPGLIRDFISALTFKLSHRLGAYNHVQRAAYWGVLFAVLMMFVTGLAIWKPVQLSWLTWLCGGYPTARVLHFIFMSGICLFIIVHVTLVALVPKTLVAMVLGRAAEPIHTAETSHAGE
ncbi:MAG: transmembrane hydrogenase cytochrome b-type subunit [Acidocella sp. 20-57-95]|nr:MAG: transmembrane hydrogenase cytochrome b-type subunit [Acidocella sp. 20-57-95]HQT65755.1 cytochrome b/b6 domain-containing protein [Acidocella sp.]HQU04409.1 cytochrome b/b6 domain-containing protein [Acidocella sp.]